MNVPGHGLSVIVTITHRPPPEFHDSVYQGKSGATADEARLLVRDVIYVEPVLPVPITLWRRGFKKPFGCRSSILSRQHFLPVKLLCFLCNNGKGKAETAIILIDSLVGVCTARNAGYGTFAARFLRSVHNQDVSARVWQGSVNHMASWMVFAETAVYVSDTLKRHGPSRLSVLRGLRIRRNVGDKEERI